MVPAYQCKIWCDTPEILDSVLEILESERITWADGRLPTSDVVSAPVGLYLDSVQNCQHDRLMWDGDRDYFDKDDYIDVTELFCSSIKGATISPSPILGVQWL